jgi:hypothetical protein
MKEFSVLENFVQRKPVVPTVIRESINWRTLDEDTVVASVDVLNLESHRSDDVELTIEAAPFGAFVPGTPVARVLVVALDPGESRNVTVRLNRKTLNELGLHPILVDSARASGATAVISPMHHPQWIGNLNIYFDRAPEQSVERHRAFNLCVPANSTLTGAFIIKDPGPCEFKVECSSPDWSVVVRNTAGLAPAPLTERFARILRNRAKSAANDPINLLRGQFRTITVKTPDRVGDEADVIVQVKRLSDSRIVPVEFEFETVDGWGQSLGCVRVAD